MNPEQRVREEVPASVGCLGRRKERRIREDGRAEGGPDERITRVFSPGHDNPGRRDLLLHVAERAQPLTRRLVERRGDRGGAVVGEAPDVDADRLGSRRGEAWGSGREERGVLAFLAKDRGAAGRGGRGGPRAAR